MKKEVEILCRLGGSKAMAFKKLAGLKSLGAKRTVDVYYFDPRRPALKPVHGRLGECFRLRQKGGRASLAYKIDHFRHGEWLYSDEHETEVADAAAAAAIIRHLGLKPLVTVDMVKYLFESAKYEVAVEEVKGLGLFVEAESRRSVGDKEVDAERGRIRAFLAGLGLKVGEEMNAGKPELRLRKSKQR